MPLTLGSWKNPGFAASRKRCAARVLEGGRYRPCALVAREGLETCWRHADSALCQAATDGDCIWVACPQLRDGEPARSRRDCPLPPPPEGD